ncbi:MAG: hypothetical protein ACI97A_000620 [Planctomycetota bacterium]|jgi:hypothetical protein
MTPSSRQSGAVHIMFLIVTIVLGLAGWGLWFGEKSKNEVTVSEKDAAVIAERNAATEAFQYKKGFELFATAVGGVPESIPAALPFERQLEYEGMIAKDFVAPVVTKTKQFVKFFGGDRSQDKLIMAATPGEALVTRLESEKAQLTSQLSTAKADKATAEKANDDMVTAHNTELSAKNDTIAQLRQKNATKEQQLESQKDGISNELRATTEKLDTTMASHTKEITTIRETNAALDRDVRDIKLTERTQRERNQPDGQITDVNYREGTCFINIGTKHGLRRGTRFKTYSFAKGRVKVFHGYIVVRDTERDRALCALENGARPSRMNYITSPHYDRESSKTFHFLGNLPGRFNNQTASKILGQYGMKVSDDFNLFVDFLVLASNPELPEEGEEADPNWFKKTQAYSDAVRWGVEMIRAEDLETYLKY